MFYLINGLAIHKNFSSIIDGIDITQKFKKEQIFARTKGQWSLYIIETGEIFRLVISTKERRTAYDLLYLLKGFYTIFIPNLAISEENCDLQLLEFRKKPNKDWTEEEWFNNLNQKVHYSFIDYNDLSIQLQTTMNILFHGEAEQLKLILENAMDDIRIIETLNHIRQSIQLFNGVMSPSYYHSHYKSNREQLSKDSIEKAYFEMKEKYELAFLAAFKSLERILNVNDIKRKEINNVLLNSGFDFTKPQKKYIRAFEGYKNLKEDIYQNEIIEHFLNLRNTVGAHANRKPPADRIISFDNIYEIQHFVINWIEDYFEEVLYL